MSISKEFKIRQLNHEINWAKAKIKSLPINKQKQIKDLERQIKEREDAISKLLNSTH